MPATPETSKIGRWLTVERTAPALALLAQGAYASDAAEAVGVSVATVLNWMDWAWKHRDEVNAHLHENYPELGEEQLAHLWERIERRRSKRERRLDFADWRSGAR
jgi:hypothetical protein